MCKTVWSADEAEYHNPDVTQNKVLSNFDEEACLVEAWWD
jgi:hypothetical protein